MEHTALIAGTGFLPVEATRIFSHQKQSFFIVSLFPHDNLKALHNASDGNTKIVPLNHYKASELLALLKQHNTKKIFLIGKFDKRHLLKNIKFDWLATKIIASSLSKSDKTLMENILSAFEKEGMSVMSQDNVLNKLFIPPGILTGKVTRTMQTDIELGMNIAQTIATHDIGQTVVMKDGMILAIEAIEGTDNCIQRGIELGKTNIVICKSAHNKHNTKYDLPTLGPETLQSITKGSVAAIAWQSSHTLIVQQEEFIAKAKEKNIALVSV